MASDRPRGAQPKRSRGEAEGGPGTPRPWMGGRTQAEPTGDAARPDGRAAPTKQRAGREEQSDDGKSDCGRGRMRGRAIGKQLRRKGVAAP